MERIPQCKVLAKLCALMAGSNAKTGRKASGVAVAGFAEKGLSILKSFFSYKASLRDKFAV
jgi:hypothetical protein